MAQVLCDVCGPFKAYLCAIHAGWGDIEVVNTFLWVHRRDRGAVTVLGLHRL